MIKCCYCGNYPDFKRYGHLFCAKCLVEFEEYVKLVRKTIFAEVLQDILKDIEKSESKKKTVKLRWRA